MMSRRYSNIYVQKKMFLTVGLISKKSARNMTINPVPFAPSWNFRPIIMSESNRA